VCNQTATAIRWREYRDDPLSDRVTSTVVHFTCKCGNQFVRSFGGERETPAKKAS
jgi:hypothetical protein